MKKKKVCSDEYHYYAYFSTIVQRKFWAGRYYSNVIQFSKMTITGIRIKNRIVYARELKHYR